MYSPARRIGALAAVRAAGITSVGVVSPLLPLAEPRRFAEALAQACDRVILDHYLVGDGIPERSAPGRAGSRACSSTLVTRGGRVRAFCGRWSACSGRYSVTLVGS